MKNIDTKEMSLEDHIGYAGGFLGLIAGQAGAMYSLYEVVQSNHPLLVKVVDGVREPTLVGLTISSALAISCLGIAAGYGARVVGDFGYRIGRQVRLSRR